MLPLITIGIAVAAVGACDRATAPTIASVGGQAAIASSSALTISPSQVTIATGSTAQLSTNAGTTQQGQLQWFSSNNALATVSPTGLVTGFAPGAVTISARFSFDTTRAASATVVVANQ